MPGDHSKCSYLSWYFQVVCVQSVSVLSAMAVYSAYFLLFPHVVSSGSPLSSPLAVSCTEIRLSGPLSPRAPQTGNHRQPFESGVECPGGKPGRTFKNILTE